MARSAALLQALEVGTCRLAGHLPALEDAAVLRQAGQHQPDRVAAAVVSYDVLAHAATEPMHIVTPNRRRPPRPRRPDATAARAGCAAGSAAEATVTATKIIPTT